MEVTGSDGHPAKADDPLASQRTAMIGKAVASEFALERALATLRDGGPAMIEGRQQLEALRQLQRQIGTADASTLAQLGRELTATLAAVHAVADKATAAANDTTVGQASDAAHIDAEARHEVRGFLYDFYDRKIFDRYLRFASADDEAEYRKREDAYRKAIEAALAEGTPEGTLRALELQESQLRDAGAHGANASPDFAEMVERNRKARDQLSSTLADNVSPAKPPMPLQSSKDSPTLPNGQLGDVVAALTSAGVANSDAATSGHSLPDVRPSTGRKVCAVG